MKVISQKVYIKGTEYIYDCSIDEQDIIHFVYGKSNGMSSNMENFIDEKIGEFSIDFPKFRNFIKLENSISEYIVEDFEDYIIIRSIFDEKEISITKKFLKDSYDILEKMWIED